MRRAMFAVLTFLLLAGAVLAATTNPWSSDAAGNEKNQFTTAESVYAASMTLMCPNLDASGNGFVKLYIVNDQNNWNPGDPLVDVAGGPQSVRVTSWKIQPAVKIWDSPQAGSYDIVIDCEPEDGLYEPGDPIDDIAPTGFAVTSPPAGGGSASGGNGSPGDHGWWYDPNADPANVMIQLKVTADTEAIQLTKITLTASGSGDDKNDITAIKIYRDVTGNGKFERGSDTEMGSGAYPSDNGKTTINLAGQGGFINKGAAGYFLVTYELTAAAAQKAGNTYSFTINSIIAHGSTSGQDYSAGGTPIYSGTKTTLAGQLCTGNITLDLSPHDVYVNRQVNATAKGMANCDGKTVTIKKGSGWCKNLDETAGTCAISGGRCGTNFTAPSSMGQYAYTACIDKDGNGKYGGPGEEGEGSINVIQPTCTQSTCGGCANEAECSAAGCGWCGGDKTCKQSAQVECQPPSGKGKDQYCTRSCSWAYCKGTADSCYSEAGACKACTTGQVCASNACVEENATPGGGGTEDGGAGGTNESKPPQPEQKTDILWMAAIAVIILIVAAVALKFFRQS